MNTKKSLTITIVEENENVVIAQVTKSFEKKSRVFGTDEYKLWREFRKDYPNAKMTTKSIKKNPNKETNRNLTYKNMREYIKVQPKADELMKQFERELQLSKVQTSPYRAVLAWFKQKFEGYDDYKEFFEELKKKEAEAEAEAEVEDVKTAA